MGHILIVLTILLWGVTFTSTRVLLKDFSSIEIQLLRFSLAWVTLVILGKCLHQPFRREGRAPSLPSPLVQPSREGSTPSLPPPLVQPSREGRAPARPPPLVQPSWEGRAPARPPTFTSRLRARLREELTFAGMGFFGVTVCQFLENCAIGYTNASNVAALDSTGAIVTVLLLWWCLGEKVALGRFLTGSTIAIVGVLLVGVNGVVSFQLHPIGDFMAIAAKFSWGVYSVVLEKANRRGVPSIEGMRRAFFWTLMFSLLLALVGTTEWGGTVMKGSLKSTFDLAANAERFSSLSNWGHILFLGMLASAVAYVCWNYCCSVLGSVKTSFALYFIPVVGVIFAMFFLGEPFTWVSILGGVLILLGVVIGTEKGPPH